MQESFFTLSLSQEANIKQFEYDVSRLNEQQAKEMLVELYRQMIWKEAIYRDFMKDALSR
jgi:CRISPR/Cas system-associated endoribonuclease Cas2